MENLGCTEHYEDSTAVDVGVGVSLAYDVNYIETISECQQLSL